MGLVTQGPPAAIVLDLARLGGAEVFIETGTFQGATTRWAAEHFDAVFTIERSDALYELHSDSLRQLPGVTPLLGDSRAALPSAIAKLGRRTALYWLDGHWSGEGTAGEDDECPLLAELACVATRADDIVLIDDARLFLCAPPLPHQPRHWPGIAEVSAALCVPGVRRFVQIVDDVIFAVPDTEPMRRCLTDYAQGRSAAFWQAYAALQKGASSNAATGGLFASIKRRIAG